MVLTLCPMKLWSSSYSLKQSKYSIVRYSNFQFGTDLFGGSNLYSGELILGVFELRIKFGDLFFRGSNFLKINGLSFCWCLDIVDHDKTMPRQMDTLCCRLVNLIWLANNLSPCSKCTPWFLFFVQSMSYASAVTLLHIIQNHSLFRFP